MKLAEISNKANSSMKKHECLICGQTYNKEISLYAHITSHSRQIMIFDGVTRTRNSKRISKTVHKKKNPSNQNKENPRRSKSWAEPRVQNEKLPCLNEITRSDGSEDDFSLIDFDRPHKCVICSRRYKAVPGLKWHMKAIHGVDHTGFRCGLCDEGFSAQDQLERHIKVSHSENIRVKCDVCGKNVRKFQLTNHKKTHLIIEEFKCSTCGEIFKTKENLENHVSVHARKDYECDSCKKCFRSKKLILSHLVRTHLSEVPEENTELGDTKTEKENKKIKIRKKKTKLDKPFKCDEENCHYATSRSSLLKAHKFRHNPFYKCVTCKEKFKSRSELKSHMSSHGERPYKCDQCSKSYKDNHGLGWHKKVRHDPSRLKFTCELCGKTYPFESLLTQHISLTHSEQKQTVCDICGKNVSKTYLPMHRRTHGEKQYTCDICQRTFIEKAYLKRHKMIHTGEKPYVCYVCGNLFRQHSTLTIHMRIHTGDRPYKCELCENAYKTHHNLKKHYRRSGHKVV